LFNVDIDGLEGDIEQRKKKLVSAIPSIVYCFVSPSNEGLKIGVNIDAALIKNDADFKAYYPQIKSLFEFNNITLDANCRDISRKCFVSYDPDVYTNYNAPAYELTPVTTVIPPNQKQNLTTPQNRPLLNIQDDCICKSVNLMLKATAGNRHLHRLKAARLAGGYIAEGLVDKADILEALLKASDSIADGGVTSDKEIKAIVDGIDDGRKAPLPFDDPNDFGELFPVDGTLKLKRNSSTNKIKATLDNVCKAIGDIEFCGYIVGYDTFKDQIMYRSKDDTSWIAFDDETYTLLRIELPKLGFEEISDAIIRSAVPFTAKQNKFDSAIEWLSGLEWDGVPRVGQFNYRYFSTIDTPYTRATSLYLWTALAARVLDAGCQCDMVPVYEGAQGDGKSSAIVSMAPRITESTEISFLEEEDKAVRKMRGTLLVEISELRGIHAKDVESTKAFITRRVDKWIPKYKEFTQEVPRRCVFIGTTNSKEFLTDTTGNRRWLPMTTGKIDCKAIDRDRDQLWAEAVVIYSQRGICWQDAETLAVDVHEDYTPDTDTWTEVIQNYLKNIAFDGDVTTHEVLNLALEIDSARQTKALQMRVCAVLTSIGYKKVRRNVDGVRNYVWIKDPTA
jgi:predicted P-loop ATPase